MDTSLPDDIGPLPPSFSASEDAKWTFLREYGTKVKETKEFLNVSSSEVVGENGWDSIKEVDGVTVSKKIEGEIHTIRGQTLIAASVDNILTVCKGLDYWPELDPLFKEGHVVQKLDERHDIICTVYSTNVPLVYDREFLFIECRPSRDKDGTQYLITFSIDANKLGLAVPEPLYPGVVRGWVTRGGMKIEPLPGEQQPLCKVTWIIATDPRGWIPQWVINLVSGDEPLVLLGVKQKAVQLEESKKQN